MSILAAYKFRQPIVLLKTSFNTLISYPIILVPFIFLAFIHIFILEILFFAPRYPLNILFSPLIHRFAGESFLHYPFNFILMMRWYSTLQIPLYVFFNSYFIAVSVVLVYTINNGQKVDVKAIFKETFLRYRDIFMAGFIAMFTFIVFSYSYNLLIRQIAFLPSKGWIGFIGQTIIMTAPYVNLVSIVLITTTFAFVIPLIVLEKFALREALKENFLILKKSFWFIFWVSLLPYMLYIPFVLLRMTGKVLELIRIPDLMGVLLIFAVGVLLLVEAIQYTVITLYYLLRRETV